MQGRKFGHIVIPQTIPFDHAFMDTMFQIFVDLGILVVRMGIPWQILEKTKGQISWSGYNGNNDYDYLAELCVKSGIQLCLHSQGCPEWASGGNDSSSGPPETILHYANFVGKFVAHFKPTSSTSPRILHSVEFYNEANRAQGDWKVWDGRQFVAKCEPHRWAEMQNESHIAAKTSDSKIITVSGALSSGSKNNFWETYLEDAFDSGLIMPDVFGINGYYGQGENAKKEMNPVLQSAHNILSRNEALRPIWIMEAGGGKVPDRSGEQKQSNTIVSLFTTDLDSWRENGCDQIFLSYVLDTSSDPSGIVRWPVTWPPEKKIAYDELCSISND